MLFNPIFVIFFSHTGRPALQGLRGARAVRAAAARLVPQRARPDVGRGVRRLAAPQGIDVKDHQKCDLMNIDLLKH